ncbi:hypothetical protein [Paracoccus sp. N5]|uniref:hypothetical protein n=1 Tax=Paracoccus sp. N5 TaxID=1101189 RepID=UPI0012F76B70|nr:hypothetical protein [Paracoccus sp. N5]
MIDTGPLAPFYESGRNAVPPAEEEINAEGSIDGDTIKVVIATHAGTPATAVTSWARLRPRRCANLAGLRKARAIRHAVLAGSRTRITRERLWFQPLGFDQMQADAAQLRPLLQHDPKRATGDL